MNLLNNSKFYISSVSTELNYLFRYRPYYHANEDVFINTKMNIDTNNSIKPLFIMLHGLNSSSRQFNHHVEYLKSKNIDVDIFIPQIPKRGFEDLEVCCDKIMSTLLSYKGDDIRNGVRKIFIIGISNGGRVGMLLYKSIYELNNSNIIYFTTLGSPLRGTRSASIVKNYNLEILTKFHKHKGIIESFCENNDVCNELVNYLTNNIFDFNKRSRLYASNHDMVVFPASCATIDGCDNIIVDGIGHDGLIIEFFMDQIDWCVSHISE